MNDSTYFIKRADPSFIETGFAKKLIPLEKVGKFATFGSNGDTLWTTNYLRNYYPEIEVNKAAINDSIYEIVDIEKEPEYNNSKNYFIKKIPISSVNMPIWESCPDCRSLTLSAIIDKNGYLNNINIVRTCDEGYFEQTALQEIAKLGQFSPGEKNGKVVNVRMRFLIIFDWNN